MPVPLEINGTAPAAAFRSRGNPTGGRRRLTPR